MRKFSLVSGLLLTLAFMATGQKKKDDHIYKPLQINLNESGSEFVRFILWHQQWFVTNNLESNTKLRVSSSIRRSRFLAFAQISRRFLLLTHFGVNGLGQTNATSLGNNGDAPQLFLHGAWTEFKVSHNEALYVGSGLHYWKGLTRMGSASLLSALTLDQARPFAQWHSLGVTDQFARHIGLYVKGEVGKFDYRMALNNPIDPANALGTGLSYDSVFPDSQSSTISYTGSTTPDSSGETIGNTIIEGYFRYSFLEKESSKLPYQAGTYLGKKKVFAVGLGFFSHGNGAFNNAINEHEGIFHAAADILYDSPIGQGNAINAYASIIKFDYGPNFVGRWAGTGTHIYSQFGYFYGKWQIMPYIAYQSGSFDALSDNITSLDIGLNYYINGHSAKITLEYHSIRNDYRDAPDTQGDFSQWRLQTHIFL